MRVVWHQAVRKNSEAAGFKEWRELLGDRSRVLEIGEPSLAAVSADRHEISAWAVIIEAT